jgi:hypothetical protein
MHEYYYYGTTVLVSCWDNFSMTLFMCPKDRDWETFPHTHTHNNNNNKKQKKLDSYSIHNTHKKRV